MSNDDLPAGKRYSLIYAPVLEGMRDSARMRKRLLEAFNSYVQQSHGSTEAIYIGKHIERELGIDVIGKGPENVYLSESALFVKSDLHDLLDAITLIFRVFARSRIGNRAEKYISEVRRIFAETGMAFRIDDEGGVHPLIDQAFEANRASAVRDLAGPQFVAARAAIEDIDEALMEDPQNYLRAVRSAFEAVENIFKQTFPGVTHLNGQAIDKYLSKLSGNADVITANDQHSFVKQVRAFTNWVDSVHFYRHASGEPEPAPPSEDHAILLISMGLSYSRWIAWLFNRIAAARVVPRI